MPLYIEILDESADLIQSDENTRVLSSWTSESTSETVRLIDAAHDLVLPNANRSAMRILFC